MVADVTMLAVPYLAQYTGDEHLGGKTRDCCRHIRPVARSPTKWLSMQAGRHACMHAHLERVSNIAAQPEPASHAPCVSCAFASCRGPAADHIPTPGLQLLH